MRNCPVTGEKYCIHDRCWKEWLEEMENDPTENRIAELESEVAELWDRLKQMDNVLTTAFGVVTDGRNPVRSNHTNR